MITIVKPKESIDRLWGKQRISINNTYRMMRYVLRVDYDQKVLLHNVVTGQLVVLNEDEASVLNNLPSQYNQVLKSLVIDHFLVPESFDEHQQVLNLRAILKRISDTQQPKSIVHYTILPTTACNARCYYCFEQGIKPVTMTQQTANDLVEFIESHCDNNRFVRISWFGGEPLVAANRINQICKGLQNKGIGYESDITTNGFLFDEDLADKAVKLWHVKKAMICFDGTEKRYNEIKAYVNPQENPYQRVMRNIGFLLEREVYVNLRMNFDLNNFYEFSDLVNEANNRFGQSPFLQMRVHPVVGSYPDHNGKIDHASEAWFTEKIVELGDITRKAGYMSWHATELPFMNYKGCQACDDRSLTIMPQGSFVHCPEHLDDNEITGNVVEGITNSSLYQSWRIMANKDRCIDCEMKPFCFILEKCTSSKSCSYSKELKNGAKRTMRHFYEIYKDLNEEG